MNLTKSQKKFLKKNLKKLAVKDLAVKLEVPENELVDYLQTFLPRDKFKKIVQKSQEPDFDLKLWFKQNRLFLAMLAFLVLVTYANSLGNEFLSDDIAGIVQDKNMGNILFYLRHHTINFSRYFFYSLVYKLFGLNPIFFRLINVIFHIGCTWLVFGIVSLLASFPLALIVAAIFSVHPLLSESITWISGGLYTQYSFFLLLSFFLYLIARKRNWPAKYYWSSVAFFVPALLTTEKAAVLPGLIFAFEVALGKISRNWKQLIPYAGLSAVIAIMVFFGGQLGSRISALKSDYYQESGLYNPLTQIPTAISSYLWLMVWPDKLTLYHSEMIFPKIQYALMFLVTLAFFGATVWTFVNKKYRWFSFWLAFFFISLTPMLTPLKVAWIVAERYVYLGSIGIFVLIGMLIEKAGERLKNKNLSFIILGVLVMALAGRTIVRNVDWKNQDNLWLAAGRTSPSSPQNHNNLGDLYSRRKEFDKAVVEFKKAIELLPNYGDAYHNLANTYLQMGKIELAIENYQNALKYNPNLWQSHQNLAAIYAQNDRLDLTEEHLKKALAINPNSPNLMTNLGIVLSEEGKKEEAKAVLLKALEIDPANQNARKFLENLESN